MTVLNFIVTRQLTGYSGSDKYLNLDSYKEIHDIYNGIMDRTISSINGEVVTALPLENIVKFCIKDSILNKKFKIHIKKSHDGLRFTITEYVNYIKMSPNTILTIFIDIQDTDIILIIKTEYFYKYILEKHSSEAKYRILIENSPSIDRTSTTSLTDDYLKNFNIINAHNNSLNWRGRKSFNSYICEYATKKYIGIPYSTNLELEEFNNIEEII